LIVFEANGFSLYRAKFARSLLAWPAFADGPRLMEPNWREIHAFAERAREGIDGYYQLRRHRTFDFAIRGERRMINSAPEATSLRMRTLSGLWSNNNER